MQDNDMKKGNLLVRYIFPDATSTAKDIDNEYRMKNELAELVKSWKDKGYIDHFVVTDDECISDKLRG